MVRSSNSLTELVVGHGQSFLLVTHCVRCYLDAPEICKPLAAIATLTVLHLNQMIVAASFGEATLFQIYLLKFLDYSFWESLQVATLTQSNNELSAGVKFWLGFFPNFFSKQKLP